MRDKSEDRKPWPWWLKLLLGVSPILVLLGIGFLFDGNARRRLNRAMEEARAGGGPVTIQELQAARRVWSDDENGALVIVSLSSRLSAIPGEEGMDALPIFGAMVRGRRHEPPPLGGKWPEEVDQAVAAQLERLSPELATIDRLLDYEGGRFPTKIAPNPVNTLLPHLSQLRTATRLKSSQTTYRAMHDDTASLIDDVSVMRRCGRLLEDEPFLISALVRVACDSLTVSTIEDVCAHATLTPEQLTQLEQQLAAMASENRMYWGMLGERGFFIGAADWFRKTGDLSGAGGPTLRVTTKLPGLRGWLMRDQATGLRLFNRIIRVLEDPERRLQVARETDAELEKLGDLSFFWSPMTRQLMPSVARSLELDLRLTAQARCAQTALAIERYRIDNGLFPQQLDQLMPRYLDCVPTDPFDRKPLRYRVDDDAVIAYSVGEDMTDNGGEVEQRTTGSRRDRGFVLLVPEARGRPAANVQDKDGAKPNMIFILTDDMRWDAMGCAGNGLIKTPNLDRLADRGVMFRNAFCTTSICSVSRASFLTGQHARRHGVRDFSTPLSPQGFARSFPALLRKNGYRTGFVGKWGLGGLLPEEEFDHWAGYAGQGKYFENGDPEHLTAKMGEKALRFISESRDRQPFLLCVSTKAPHCQDQAPKQFQPDPAFDHLYQDVTIPAPKTANAQAFEALPEFIRRSEGRTRWQRRFNTPERYQDSVKNYYRLITGVDHLVGRIMSRLDELKLADSTVVIFTSDNGFFLGERGLAGKWLMYEESIRLPLIVRHPKLRRGSGREKIEEMVLTIDIAPTIMDFAGVDIPSSVQGRSLKPLMSGKPSTWRREWFYEHHYGHKGRIPRTEGVRTGQWKYTRYIDSQPLYEELFDLQADPFEEHNLAPGPQHADALKRMRQRWGELAEAAK